MSTIDFITANYEALPGATTYFLIPPPPPKKKIKKKSCVSCFPMLPLIPVPLKMTFVSLFAWNKYPSPIPQAPWRASFTCLSLCLLDIRDKKWIYSEQLLWTMQLAEYLQHIHQIFAQRQLFFKGCLWSAGPLKMAFVSLFPWNKYPSPIPQTPWRAPLRVALCDLHLVKIYIHVLQGCNGQSVCYLYCHFIVTLVKKWSSKMNYLWIS